MWINPPINVSFVQRQFLVVKRRAHQFWFAGAVSLYCLAMASPSQAQVTRLETSSTKITTPDKLNFTITGGSRAGGNLFHSFDKFSVPEGGSAFFKNNPGVENIISRVTGSSISNIDGSIKANGSANLFLLNPKGIIFHSGARLEIGGSFLASTANRLNFSDGTSFSATDLQAQPLLTISVPVGLQFDTTGGSIRVNGQLYTPSLEVQPGKTLALMGSGVFVEGGFLTAPEGRIELGSIASNGLINLNSITEDWVLGYEGVKDFQDITLSQKAVVNTGSVDTSGAGSGAIQLRGRQITITDSSFVGGVTQGKKSGESLVVNASEFVEVSDKSSLFTTTLGAGNTGDITITTMQLIVRDSGEIRAYAEKGSTGQAGTITIDASKSVQVTRSRDNLSLGAGLIEAQTFGVDTDTGNAGVVKIKTGKLVINRGGQIATSTRGAGEGGTLIVDASESVEVSSLNSILPSGLFAQSRGQATGKAGNLKINTGRLILQDGAQVTVSSTGSGPAGELTVQARSIQIDNKAAIKATTNSGNGGNVTLQFQDLLLLRRNSSISTSAGLTGTGGDGGNITINDPSNPKGLVVAVPEENSDITANAFEGKGGFIQINAQGVFGLERREGLTSLSDITAFSEQNPELNGVVEINTPDVDPSQGLTTLPTEPVNTEIAQDCQGNGGNETSRFINSGRGGLPTNPYEPLDSSDILADVQPPTRWADAENTETQVHGDNGTFLPQPTPLHHVSAPAPATPPNQIAEAQGWSVNDKGEVVLVAEVPQRLSQRGCHLH